MITDRSSEKPSSVTSNIPRTPTAPSSDHQEKTMISGLSAAEHPLPERSKGGNTLTAPRGRAVLNPNILKPHSTNRPMTPALEKPTRQAAMREKQSAQSHAYDQDVTDLNQILSRQFADIIAQSANYIIREIKSSDLRAVVSGPDLGKLIGSVKRLEEMASRVMHNGENISRSAFKHMIYSAQISFEDVQMGLQKQCEQTKTLTDLCGFLEDMTSFFR